MAEADKSGRVAQLVGDLHATLGMAANEGFREARVRFIRHLVEATDDGPDGPCYACERHYPTWRAPNDLWNLVMGGPNAKGDPGGMLCPNCFLRLASEAAPARGAWVVGTPVRPEHIVKAEALQEAASASRTAHVRWTVDILRTYGIQEHVAEQVAEALLDDGLVALRAVVDGPTNTNQEDDQ